MKTVVAVPMKAPVDAKTRLAGALAPDERTGLALQLFERTQTFFETQFPLFDRLVITPSAGIARQASHRGTHVVVESGARGLNGAARQALQWARERGFDRLLLVPADIPVWLRREVHLLLAAGAGVDVVIGRAHDGGTNALLFDLSRVEAFGFRYGEASASRHEESCRQARLIHATCSLPFMSRDLDTLEDLRELRPSLRLESE